VCSDGGIAFAAIRMRVTIEQRTCTAENCPAGVATCAGPTTSQRASTSMIDIGVSISCRQFHDIPAVSSRGRNTPSATRVVTGPTVVVIVPISGLTPNPTITRSRSLLAPGLPGDSLRTRATSRSPCSSTDTIRSIDRVPGTSFIPGTICPVPYTHSSPTCAGAYGCCELTGSCGRGSHATIASAPNRWSCQPPVASISVVLPRGFPIALLSATPPPARKASPVDSRRAARYRGHMRARLAILALALGGCDPEIASERGDWKLVFPGLSARAGVDWPAPHLLLAGSRVCPELACNVCPEGQTCDDAAISAAGLTLDGDCFRADAPGEVVWTVGPPCVADGQPPDRATMQVVALADTVPALYSADDQAVVALDLQTAGAPWLPRPEFPLRVVAGSQVEFAVDLERAGHYVAREPARGDATWTTTAGRPPAVAGGLQFTVFPDTGVDVAFHLDDRTWPLGHVLGVSRDAVAALELAAAFDREGAPARARAIARDRNGNVLHGAPVTWSVDDRALSIAPQLPNQDHVGLGDCRPPERRAGPRVAVLRARLGDREATLHLEWTGVAGAADPAWEQPGDCDDRGCDCTTGDPSSLVLVLLALGLPRRRRLALRTCLFLPLACADPPQLSLAGAHELGALAWDPRISSRDGGYSARVGDRSVWVFGDTVADKAPDALPGFLNNTACTTRDLDARDGLVPLDEHLDERGYAHEFLPLTADELAHELAHNGPDCGDSCEGVALWPGPLIPDPERGRVLVFYAKLFQRPGPLDVTVVGTSLAVWDDTLPAQAVRPTVAPDSPEPTLLFTGGDPELAAAALVDGEHILAYTCDGDGFDKPCRLARAPLADPLKRQSWQFLARGGEWSDDPDRAVKLFDGAPMMTVHHKPQFDLFVATYAEPAGADIVIRTAPRPEGPWSDAATVHRALRPIAELNVYGALLHPEFASADGTVDYLTYYIGETGTLQLVELRWHSR
jgi:hypothetical protein